MKRIKSNYSDCNRCSRAKCSGKSICPGHIPVKSGWKFAELVLAHPTSLNSLHNLSFDVTLPKWVR